MRVVFLEPAESEFLDAVQYYNEQKAGLGYEFALEIQKTIERILWCTPLFGQQTAFEVGFSKMVSAIAITASFSSYLRIAGLTNFQKSF